MSTIEWLTLFIGIGTWAYVVFVGWTLYYIKGQFEEAGNSLKLESTLVIFRELQTREAREARRYIYAELPFEIHGLPVRVLQEHLERSEEAFTAFDRIGHLLKEEHLDVDFIVTKLWPMIWRCWRRSRSLIRWSQQARNDEGYMAGFEFLFDVCETYRKENNLSLPRFYRSEPRIILTRS